MRFVYFNDFRLGVLERDSVVDITEHLSDIPVRDNRDLINGLIENYDKCKASLEQFVAANDGIPSNEVQLRSPCPRPNNIDCMAVNYMEDGTRSEPAPINAFHKATNTVIGNGDTMELTDIPASIFEGEAELAVIIGKRAENVSEENAMDYIFGYTNIIDGSARGLIASNFFFQMKSRATYTPIGPCLVTKDEIDDPQNLQIVLRNNGVVMQNFNTDDMAHKIPKCIAWLSSTHTLEPGDIIATGTNHRGLNPFMDGDKIELEIEQIGTLNFNVRDPLKRTWERVTRKTHIEDRGLEGAHTPQLTGKYAKGETAKASNEKGRKLTSI